MLSFDCPRTCPNYSERWCRFRPVLDQIGPVKVDSHTARIEVEMKNAEALKTAVEAIGGKWLGQGKHRLYGGQSTGYGFTLPGWQYPLVLEEGGRLAYDDFNGSWGNVKDLDRLKGSYAVGMAEHAARLHGWNVEKTNAGVVIHHPSGGTLTVNAQGILETAGFIGAACHEARETLGLPTVDIVNTTEGNQTACKVQTR